jgi:hypothetical protein
MCLYQRKNTGVHAIVSSQVRPDFIQPAGIIGIYKESIKKAQTHKE